MTGTVRIFKAADRNRLTLTIVALTLGLMLVACSSSGDSSAPNLPSLPETPEYSGFLAATEFLVGENRFPFGLVSVDGVALEDTPVQVSFYYLGQESKELRVHSQAPFVRIQGVNPHKHDDGQIHEHLDVRGV